MKKFFVLLSALAVLAWGGVIVGCSDGSESGDYDPNVLEGLWIDSEDDASAVYFKDGKAYLNCEKGDDGNYTSAEDGAPYSVKGDVITVGDEAVKILDMRVKDYVKLAADDKTTTYKYSDKAFSSGDAGDDGEEDKYDYKQELGKSQKTAIYLDVPNGHIAKNISFEYRADDVAEDVDMCVFIKVGEGWSYVKIPGNAEDDVYPKLAKDWKKITTVDLPVSGASFVSGDGWYFDEGTKNGDLKRIGMEVSPSANGGSAYIRNLKVIGQDGAEIDVSELDWGFENYD